MNSRSRERFARAFGLPPTQMRYYNELTAAQKDAVLEQFGNYRADQYIYAVKRDETLVWRREDLASEWKL